MSDAIRVRMYNVGFGDAFLVSIPDRDDSGQPLTRHILVDLGNVTSGEGGRNELFVEALTDIREQVGDRGVDLFVMTHEHLDHVQGLLFGATQDPPIVFPVHTVWLTASADPTYRARFPEAERKLDQVRAVYAAAQRHVDRTPQTVDSTRLVMMLRNNNPAKTADCVRYLREELTNDVHYVHRGFDTSAAHPFRDATFEILAPELDTTDYYGRFKPMAFGVESGLSPSTDPTVVPPRGVDTTAFYDLVAARAGGVLGNLLAIDKAANNTSVVLTIAWRGKLLLFAGDAEERSWRTINRECQLGPVDFIKVSHHGSHNGTPDDSLLDSILPAGRADPDRARAALSTFEGSYGGVPHRETLERLAGRCHSIVCTQAAGQWADIVVHTDGPFQDIVIEAAR